MAVAASKAATAIADPRVGATVTAAAAPARAAKAVTAAAIPAPAPPSRPMATAAAAAAALTITPGPTQPAAASRLPGREVQAKTGMAATAPAARAIPR